MILAGVLTVLCLTLVDAALRAATMQDSAEREVVPRTRQPFTTDTWPSERQ